MHFIRNPEDRPTAEELLSHPFVQKEDGFEFKVITFSFLSPLLVFNTYSTIEIYETS